MTSISPVQAPRKRRRFSREFKARIVDAYRQPDVSVAGVALTHGLNANLVHRWIRQARQDLAAADAPAFIPLPMPRQPVPSAPAGTDRIRIEIPHRQGPLVVEWPVSAAVICQVFLRDLLP